MADTNRKLYNSLIKKSYGRSDLKYDINKASKMIKDRTIPKPNKESTSNDDRSYYDKLLNKTRADYDKKLQNLDSSYKKQLKDNTANSNASIYKLRENLAKSENKLSQLAEGTSGAFKKFDKQLSEQTSSSQAAIKELAAAAAKKGVDEEDPNEGGGSFLDFFDAKKSSVISENDASEKTIDEKKEIGDVVNEIVFKNTSFSNPEYDVTNPEIDKKYSFGEYQLKLTNLFGLRKGKNAVSGISTDEHSRGIDFRLFKDGKAVDYPVILADGKIIEVGGAGEGATIHPTKGRSGGYYVRVQLDNNPNKVVTYMHLPKAVLNNKENLVGKQVKRGDILAEDNGSSGSITEKHIKISIGDYDVDKGELTKNYSDESNNPTKLFFTGLL